MVYRFRGRCLACGHDWDGLRRRIECGRVDFAEPESYRCQSCARCVVELYIPRQQSRISLAALGFTKRFGDDSRSTGFAGLRARRDDRPAGVEVISRSTVLFRACERVSSNVAASSSKYVCASVDIGEMTCPDCDEAFELGELETELLVCPVCEERSAAWTSEIQPLRVRVDYSPLDAGDVSPRGPSSPGPGGASQEASCEGSDRAAGG